MANPSTVWTQLALPTAASGSIPFVDTDNVTIITDVLNFFYNQTLKQLLAVGGLKVGYTDSTAIPGAATINKPAGRCKIAVGQTTIVITNSLVSATSIVQVQLETADGTGTRVIVTPAAGFFTVTFNAAVTAAVTFTFSILNVQ